MGEPAVSNDFGCGARERWLKTSSDYEGVRTWLKPVLAAAAARSLGSEPLGVPIDYAEWIGYLLWLNSCLSAGVLSPGALDRDEMEGLRLLDEVTREVQQQRRCPRCGSPAGHPWRCQTCGAELAAAAPAVPRSA